jgi:uncharacterized protein
MLQFNLLLTILLLATVSTGCANENEIKHQETLTESADHSVLVFSKTAGFRHDSIEEGAEAIKKLGQENGFNVTRTEDSSYFIPENLAGYDAVIFLNTTMTVFNEEQRAAFKSYIQSGGGFVGVHSATDTEYDWPWYGEMVGAYFMNHPPVLPAVIDVVNPDHPSTAHLPVQWERIDEWYNFRNMNPEVNVLLKLDTDSFEGSEHPGNHPIAWYHDYDGGRAFYTGLGHTKETYTEENFLLHLLGGIRYAMGIE